MRRRRPWLWAVLVAAGCQCPGSTVPSDPTDCARGDGTVRVAISAQPNTLDWNRSSETSYVNYPVIHAMMRGLTQLDQRHQPVPDLADRWDVALTTDTPPRQVFTFHLRPGVLWSDGVTPHVAQDYVFAWKRALKSGFETAELSDLLGADEVIAARESKDPAALDAALARVGVEALAERTLRVTLKSPRSYFLARIAYVYPYFPAPSRLLEGKSEDELHRYFDQPTAHTPVVLGAFRIAGWDRSAEGSPLRLELNPHGPSAADPRAVKSLTVLQSSLGQLLYQRCAVDFLYMDEPWMLRRPGVEASRQPLLSVYWLGLNAAKVHPALRRAIAHAVDRQTLMQGLLPTARPAFGLLPDELPGAVSETDPLAAAFPRFDPARARALVKESGYDGRPLTLLVRNAGTFMPEIAVADALRRQLREVGVEVKLVPTSDFSNDIKAPDGSTRHHLFLRRTGADYAHPQTFFTPFLPTGINYTGFAGLEGGKVVAQFKQLDEDGAAETDPARAKEIFTRAQGLLVADHVLVVPLYYPDRYFKTRRWIDGLGIDPFNFITLRQARIRTEAK